MAVQDLNPGSLSRESEALATAPLGYKDNCLGTECVNLSKEEHGLNTDTAIWIFVQLISSHQCLSEE